MQNRPGIPMLLMHCDRSLQERYETTYFAPFKVGIALHLYSYTIIIPAFSFSLRHHPTL